MASSVKGSGMMAWQACCSCSRQCTRSAGPPCFCSTPISPASRSEYPTTSVRSSAVANSTLPASNQGYKTSVGRQGSPTQMAPNQAVRPQSDARDSPPRLRQPRLCDFSQTPKKAQPHCAIPGCATSATRQGKPTQIATGCATSATRRGKPTHIAPYQAVRLQSDAKESPPRLCQTRL